MQHPLPDVPKSLTGIIAPMFTPRHADGRLDLDGARNLIRWYKSLKCVNSVFVRSGVGEMYAFTVEEARQLSAAVIDEAGGELGVLAGSAGEFDGNPDARPDPQRYLEQGLELGQFAKERGADAAVYVLPWALPAQPEAPLEDTIFNYYRRLSDTLDLPIVIYQPPGVPDDYRATPSLMRRLVALPNLRGMKVSTTEHAVFDPIAEVVVAPGSRFSLIVGAEHFYLEGLEQGAAGVIGGGCNTHPEMIWAVEHHYRAGRLDRARVAQTQVNDTLRELRDLKLSGNIAGKMYIASKGYPMQPYNARRGAAQVYGEQPPELPPAELMGEFADLIDRRVEPYRRAVQEGGEIP